MRDGSSGQDRKVVNESEDVCPVVVGWRDVVCVGNGRQDAALGDSRRGDKGKRFLVSERFSGKRSSRR